MRGTNIAGLEGWWLNNGPNCSVRETQMTAQGLSSLSLYTSLPNNMRDHCDIIQWHHNCLLCFFHGKITAPVQRKCHNLSLHPLVSLPKFPVTITTPKPHHLFLIPNFVPVTLSPRYFGAPSYQSLTFIYNMSKDRYKTQACINNK